MTSENISAVEHAYSQQSYHTTQLNWADGNRQRFHEKVDTNCDCHCAWKTGKYNNLYEILWERYCKVLIRSLTVFRYSTRAVQSQAIPLHFDTPSRIEKYLTKFNVELLTYAKLNNLMDRDKLLLITLWRRLWHKQTHKHDLFYCSTVLPRLKYLSSIWIICMDVPLHIIESTLWPQMYTYVPSNGAPSTKSGFLGRSLVEHAKQHNATVVYLVSMHRRLYLHEKMIGFIGNNTLDIGSRTPYKILNRYISFSVVFPGTDYCFMVPLEYYFVSSS